MSRPFLIGVAAAWIGLAAFPALAQVELKTAMPADIKGFMPGRFTDVYTGMVLQNVYEGLVAPKADGAPVPMLAESIKVSEDGKEYLFTLRQGVKFHNGAPLTAREVVWSWNQFLDPKSAWSCRSYFNSPHTKLEGVDAVDERTVRFRLAAPSKLLLSSMARSDCDSTGIAHPESVGADGSWTKAIGTGPFMLAEWRPSLHVQLRKYPDYAGLKQPSDGLSGAKPVLVDSVRILLIGDSSAAKAALQRREIDLWTTPDATDSAELREKPGIKVVHGLTAAVNAITFQTADPLLSDVRVRRAIVMAVDSKAIIDALFDGKAEPHGSPIMATSPFYGPVQRQTVPYDPAGAVKLLKEAGYKGQKLTLTTNPNAATMKDTAIMIQAMLAQVGLNVDVEMVELGTMVERYFGGRYHLMTYNYAATLDPGQFLDRVIGDKARDKAKVWDSSKSRELLAALVATDDRAEKQRVMDDLHRLYLEELPLIAWTTRVSFAAYSDRVKGYEIWPGGKPRFWNIALAP